MKAQNMEMQTNAKVDTPRILLIDNVDSFTYNLVDELYRLGAKLQIVRNTISESDLERFVAQSDLVILSPGPGTPENAGICVPLIQKYRGKLPILGICLGHQAIVHAYGGKVAKAELPAHGVVSTLKHNEKNCFKGLPNPLSIGRYHSLTATEIPDSLIVLATSDGLIMSVIDQESRVIGFQFHPESILTPHGTVLLGQTLNYLLAA